MNAQARVPADVTLAQSQFGSVFQQFARDENSFRSTFKQAFEKMLDLGATFETTPAPPPPPPQSSTVPPPPPSQSSTVLPPPPPQSSTVLPPPPPPQQSTSTGTPSRPTTMPTLPPPPNVQGFQQIRDQFFQSVPTISLPTFVPPSMPTRLATAPLALPTNQLGQ